jgi:hypothetical protein
MFNKADSIETHAQKLVDAVEKYCKRDFTRTYLGCSTVSSCMCVCIYIYIHICVCVCVCVGKTHAQKLVDAVEEIQICMHSLTQNYSYTQTYVNTNTNTYIRKHKHIHACMHAYIYIYKHTGLTYRNNPAQGQLSYEHTYTHTYIHTYYIYTQSYICIYIHVLIYTHTYLHTYIPAGLAYRNPTSQRQLPHRQTHARHSGFRVPGYDSRCTAFRAPCTRK